MTTAVEVPPNEARIYWREKGKGTPYWEMARVHTYVKDHGILVLRVRLGRVLCVDLSAIEWRMA